MLQKLASRKFLLSISAIASALLGLDMASVVVIGAVAISYVVIEGLIDRARAEQLADAVRTGLDLGRRAADGADES